MVATTDQMVLASSMAIAEGRKLRDSITAKLQAESPPIDPEDGVVVIVFAKRDFSELNTEFFEIPVNSPLEIEIKAATKHAGETPIGFLVAIRDQNERKLFTHARPLIVEDPRALALNERAYRVWDKTLRAALETAN